MTAPRRRMGAVDWIALAVVCLAAALAALIECLLVPLYHGGTLVPVTVVAAVAGNVGLPLLARTVCPRTLGVAAPFIVWLVVVIGFGLVTRPEGDVILPGGTPQWVAYGLLLGGALAGGITVVALATPPRPPVRRDPVAGRPRPPAAPKGS